jgi:hypothetical protein
MAAIILDPHLCGGSSGSLGANEDFLKAGQGNFASWCFVRLVTQDRSHDLGNDFGMGDGDEHGDLRPDGDANRGILQICVSLVVRGRVRRAGSILLEVVSALATKSGIGRPCFPRGVDSQLLGPVIERADGDSFGSAESGDGEFAS